MIKTKYVSKVGKNYKISEHFTLGEFQSHDGTDKVIYSTAILAMLEKLRKKYGGSISITSGYRSPSYNAKVNGASNSAHMDGKAADFVVYDKDGKLINPKLICLYLESIGWKWGIGQMRTATHFDTKFKGNRMDETKNPYIYLQKKGLTFKQYYGVKSKYTGAFPSNVVNENKGTKSDIKKWQKFLCWYGSNVTVDGKFGFSTKAKTIIFQKKNDLTTDGSVGIKTIEKAMKVKR